MKPRALMQTPSERYASATTGAPKPIEIDVDRARRQHEAVVLGMEWLGYTVELLDGREAGPDAVFVEDPFVLHGGRAVALQSAHPVRALEGRRLRAPLASWGLQLVEMTGIARLDGGDVMILGDTAWVGRTARSNDPGARALGQLLDVEIRQVDMPSGVLHLKCEVAPLPGGRILATPALAERIDAPAVIVPPHEAYAANVVAYGSRVLCAEGFPQTAQALREAGFEVRLLDLSEMRKGDGSITCLSLREPLDEALQTLPGFRRKGANLG